MTLLTIRFKTKSYLFFCVVIFFFFPGCAGLDGVFPKYKPQKPVETNPPLPSTESVSQKQAQLSEENTQLLIKIEKIQQQLSKIQKQQKDLRDDFLILQEQWEMNFVLLERSVEESLRSSKVSESTASMVSNVLGKNSLQQNAGKSKILKQKSLKPIENYSLLKNTEMGVAKPTVSSVRQELVEKNNSEFKEEKEDVEEEPGFVETGAANLNDLENTLAVTNDIDLPDPKIRALKFSDSSVNIQATGTSVGSLRSDFSDPDLVPPEDPFILIRHPGVKKIYNQGMTAVIQKNHHQAILVFENFTTRFPDNIDSDNAFYWIGRAYFELNEWEKAEESFRKVLTRYEHLPTSQGYKTSDSIYMLGKLQLQKNLEQRASYYFEEVIKLFPGSAAARNAERDLGR